ncbi:unnamed protein product [Callosobruchus maculatus]|uniref:Uncharacterized protein n=1 Tax=Callosobruchus maculatus TaxID=64391 RepID=A0A653DTY9_CALMS|nr:unnamed protein product [Callosobruchus maculatus]
MKDFEKTIINITAASFIQILERVEVCIHLVKTATIYILLILLRELQCRIYICSVGGAQKDVYLMKFVEWFYK